MSDDDLFGDDHDDHDDRPREPEPMADTDDHDADSSPADAVDAFDKSVERPTPEYSPLGTAAARAASKIPDPEKDARTTIAERTDRPEPEHSTIGAIAGGVISLVPKPLLGIRGTMYKKMAMKSIENYHKTAGGDAIAINAKAGQQVDLEPVLYRAPEEVEEGEVPGWKVKGRDKVWHPTSEGNSVNFLGKTPVVALEDDAHVEAGWLAPRIGHAIELDNYRPIFTNTQLTAVAPLAPDPQTGNGALADGGAIHPSEVGLEPNSPGQWGGDNLIDLDSGEGYDGMRISMQKAREWQAETADSEQMQMQEDRGYLRGLAEGDETDVVRVFLYAALLVLGVLAIVLLGPELIGGGDGGGGINPLMIDMAATLL